MKTKSIILAVVLCATVPLAAAPAPNQQPVRFIIVDYVPPPPKLTKSTLWAYIKWYSIWGSSYFL